MTAHSKNYDPAAGPLDKDIDELHNTLTHELGEALCECADVGKDRGLTPGETTGICVAALTQALTHLMVITNTPEHTFMTWCHDQYLQMKKQLGDTPH